MKHILDANVFIEAKNFYYQPEICPGFWNWLEDGVHGSFGTIDRVRSELISGNDFLSEWFKQRKGASWIESTSDEKTQGAFAAVSAWVQGSGPLTPDKLKFLAGADPWLVAKAIVSKAAVVTLEVAKKSPNKISLADACAQFQVPTLKTWVLLAKLKVKFVREK